MITLDEPEKWVVLLLFDGEVLGASGPMPHRRAAEAREAELRRRFPRHEVKILRRRVEWVDETAAVPA